MNITEARSLAEKYISDNIEPPDNDKYLIIDAGIKEVDDGWYFPYQTARFIQTRDIQYSVLGNWPVFVSKLGACLGPRRPDWP
ncbi:YrhB domain-containing protein [Silvimonas soli]|uniref:YrhB domain-containing protein n=1 Tax=Silvimonas soli TaxID=2980100 RepID=UPI0024B3AD2A|nr:YrhB domain-containing protein [Silvimonas soli]